MLTPGDRIASYEIVSLIGAGGMGEVYRAHDPKLDRDVALKILPAGSLANEETRKRFRKGAHALSRLSHPHIASLFDFDTSEDGTDFLVMELVSGPSLDTKLKHGPLPEKEVVRLGAQIVRALVAAHEQGIVHRDLKPANVRLTADGLVKVLDFGLAQIAPVVGEGETTDTASGSVAGTPPYMSPEQLLGKEVDERTDVYAAGVVLFEMATGRRPYGEASGPQLVAKILNEPMAAPREVNASLSPVLEQVIVKAADKDRELRHQTAKDLLVDLERLAAGLPASAAGVVRTGGPIEASEGVGHAPRGSAEARGARMGGPARLAGGVIALGLLAGVVALAVDALRPRTPGNTSFRTIAQRAHEFRGLATDGTNAYFAEKRFPTDALLVVPLAGAEAREMPVPWEGRIDLFLFDVLQGPPSLLVGRRTSLNEGFELWRLPLVGGAASRLSGLPRVAAARASRGGDRVAYVPSPGEPNAGAVILTSRDGVPRVVAPPEGGAQREIVGWLPGDTRLRYLRYPAGRGAERCFEVATNVDATTTREGREGEPCWVDDWSPDGAFAAWGAADGVLAFRERRPFWRRAEKPARLAAPSHVAKLRFTPDGRRVVALVEQSGTEIVLFDRRKRGLSPLLGGARAGPAEFSPDGTRVAWVSGDEPGRVWVSRPDGAAALALTDPRRVRVGPRAAVRWSPDGRYVAFAARVTEDDAGPPRIHVADVGRGTVEPLTADDDQVAHIDPCWAPDGRSLVYSTFFPPYVPEADAYLRRVDLEARRVEKLLGSEGLWAPKCSRDGRILAADSVAQPGQGEDRTLFKLRDPRTGRWEAFAVGASTVDSPTWSTDGRSVYATGSLPDEAGLRIVRVDVATRRVETVGRVEGLRADGWLDLAPDGGFMIHRDASRREVVVMDWEAR